MFEYPEKEEEQDMGKYIFVLWLFACHIADGFRVERIFTRLRFQQAAAWVSYQEKVKDVVHSIGDRLDASVAKTSRVAGAEEALSSGAFSSVATTSTFLTS